MQTLHRQAARQRQIVAQRAKVRGQQQFDGSVVEASIRCRQRFLPSRIEVGHQYGLVNLNPFHTLLCQLFQQCCVERQ